MNLIEVIHQRWAAATALNDLLPSTRVFTGMSVDATMPYAVITKETERPLTRHHDGSAIDLVAVQVRVFDENYDAGAAVMHEVKTALDHTNFALSVSDRVLGMQRTNDQENQTEDGVWQFTIDFNCTVYLESGV